MTLTRLKRERKICCRVFMSSIKRCIRRFHMVVIGGRRRNVLKSMMHVQSILLFIRPLILMFL